MPEELLINATPRETRIAIVENGVVQELMIERASRRGLVGNIYRGKVIRVLPGMQSAFIDIGIERAAFLHLSDLIKNNVDHVKDHVKENAEGDITKLLRPGQSILVQVIKDPMGTKGARLTAHLTIASRYLVLMPETPHIGVSQRIESAEEKERLKDLVENLLEDPKQGFIVRTAAEGVQEEKIISDIQFLKKLWKSIEKNKTQVKDTNIVHEDLSLLLRTMRDLDIANIDRIRIDSRESHTKLMNFVEQFMPELSQSIELYTGERPIFDLYSVEDEIQKALERNVQLKSGGYLVIDQTEAMTTIDVNTGAFVGHRNLEETIFKTNLEAAGALARQLRLRNLGGIIIVDFIDMKEDSHKRQVLKNLEKALEKDNARNKISEVSSLGLVEMTRKRTRESLEHLLCEACPVCNERGSIKSVETVCLEIFREILRSERAYGGQKFLVMAATEIVDILHDESSYMVAELEEFIGKPIQFKTDPLYSQEQYDVVLM
ncbi:MAG: ribonuclease E/G [Gammaproteobacteria bacterium]|nr:MAG: ribonuclease E/G [Gammaproteobacteria bacterium]